MYNTVGTDIIFWRQQNVCPVFSRSLSTNAYHVYSRDYFESCQLERQKTTDLYLIPGCILYSELLVMSNSQDKSYVLFVSFYYFITITTMGVMAFVLNFATKL
ncbi:hypothetical protein M758_10G105400 [Ceratodon purpureus]|nr:hypothetical protein M758_10G105400 [Ceratodon purpureus]